MPREHPTIKLTLPELGEFASGETRCIVASLDAEGGPWGDAAACAFRDGRLYFRLPRASRSLANLRRDPRVCCTLESHPEGAEYYTIKGALFHGRAEAPEADARPALKAAFEGLLDPVTGRPDPDGEIFWVGTDDVASFDFAKIQRRFES